ncbi:MAG: shikimate dehydrogenase [Betaproteobacteria bacterium]|nr:shikimate dehydrogenase [Betaproteobacteria bacterium]
MSSESSPSFGLAGVMGWPVNHSRSPLIHGHWIEQYRLRGAYVPLSVKPERLEAALQGLVALGFSGCNLTLPHKVEAMRWVSHVDPLARRIGAINTVVVQSDGTLRGLNTDAYGFLQSLRDADPHWTAKQGPAVVIGAGGASRAVVASLVDEGAQEVRLLNRTDAKALELAAQMGPAVKALPWSQRHEALAGCALLVQTTTQGMHGQPALDLRLDLLPSSALVCDVVYVPLDTPLLSEAKRRGHQVVDGLGMLLNQARPAFEAWFGVRPEITPALRAKVEATL